MSARMRARWRSSGIRVRLVHGPGVSAKAPPLPLEGALACPVTGPLPSTRLDRSARVIRTLKKTGLGTGPAYAAGTCTGVRPPAAAAAVQSASAARRDSLRAALATSSGGARPPRARSRATRGARIQTTVEGRQGAMAGLPRPSPAASRLAGLNRRGRSQKEPLRSAVASARAGAGRPLLAAAGRVGGSSGRCDHRASPPRGLRCEWSPGGGR